jgi:hypothetical protein
MARSVRGVVLAVVVALSTLSVAAPARAEAADDNAKVCQQTGATVKAGLEAFVSDMQQVSTQAQGGDLVGAETAVRHAGTVLADIAAKLRLQGNADDSRLKKAVGDLATEFDALAGQLTTLSGLQGFDTTHLEELAIQMSVLCGATPSPGASLPAGIPSPTGTGVVPVLPTPTARPS